METGNLLTASTSVCVATCSGAVASRLQELSVYCIILLIVNRCIGQLISAER